MPTDHRERAFEAALEESLVDAGGYGRRLATAYDATRALFPEDTVGFVRETQPDAWSAFERQLGPDLERALVEAVAKMADAQGALTVLRHGLKFYGRQVRLAYFPPATQLNEDLARLVKANRLTITRQVHFSERRPDLSVDVVLAINGIPFATLELKNPLTGQTAADARRQYEQDRDPREKLFAFKQRALVHFAVDSDEISMATRLRGRETRWLPFNRGRDGGAGNPDVPDNFKTA